MKKEWCLIATALLVLTGGDCDKDKKHGPAGIKWTGIPDVAVPVCGDESPEGRIYTCVHNNVAYTCIQKRVDQDYYDCAPKVFEKQCTLPEKPPTDAGVGKDAQ